MVENVQRKLILVFTLLAVAIGLIVIPESPFRLGLDLRGGTRLVYSIPREEEPDDPVAEEEGAVVSETITIIRNRLDALTKGVLDATIRRGGGDRVVIEIPGWLKQGGPTASATLAEPLGAESNELVLEGADPDAVAAFPEGRGVVRVAGEKIFYREREGNVLRGLVRGYQDTERASPEVGDAIELVSEDPIRNAIENLGELSLQIVAEQNDLPPSTGTDLEAERRKLEQWLEESPDAPLEQFDRVPTEKGGPHPYIDWYPNRTTAEHEIRPESEVATPLLDMSEVRPEEDWEFTGQDLGVVRQSSDTFGYPAVGFEMKTTRRVDFTDFTAEHQGRDMAIVLNGDVRSIATIREELPGGGQISGQFSPEEVQSLITVLRTGSLRIKPILEHEEVVGPTLGARYVERGFLGSCIAIVAVVAFMIWYYRRLGIFASIALFANLLLLMGGLAFLRATLTLPGIAGIILTVGMAVDANILIFDRLREEMDKGRNVKQAAKNGFDNALSAIVDANLTTLITALILYNVGTGPVKGFAVTLSIGILSSLFSALVITRLLVHFALEKGVKGFPMGTWLVTANMQFMSKAKYAVPASLVAIVAGVALFASLPNEKKLGIDFLGGAELQLNTESPQTVAAVEEVVRSIEGEIGRSATIKAVLDSSTGEGTYTTFRIEYKLPPGAEEVAGGDDAGAESRTFDQEIRAAFETADLLQEGPVDLEIRELEDGTSQARLRLYFVDEHPVSEIEARLRSQGFTEPEVSEAGTREGVYDATAEVAAGSTAPVLQKSIQRAFADRSDSEGTPFVLSEPIPEVRTVGKQVVGELKNKAILAMLISLFATVMYIRVRFAEYAYGWAAVGAVAHDVLVTLGVISVAIATGFIRVEIDLPLIAAFLTIIGYSLNDTIVVFDRVRENLPRMKGSMSEVLNTSVNQTLSRTILTSATTFVAVAILFAFNVGTGNVLEGFSFAMMVGVIVGSYSTVFIASPIVLLWERHLGAARAGAKEAKAADRKLARAEV